MAEVTAALDLEDLRAFVADVLDVDVEEVTDDADFVETLGVDSLMALEVMVVLEKKYAVKLHEQEIKQVTCLRKVYELLAAKLEK
ncbi:acyl carrier protein [Streptomyces sp. B1866]|uniref:acyl carrier protein n=1 Tax=Streptomyces sp. B1866 TaxID=3075431 RepID=UPI00289004E2|nr:acyl carrier protein [Streptomyces sp. B1866]MDT3399156.1 acyl carrier protein [Streptomyces sp. B1866]